LKNWNNPVTKTEEQTMHPDALALLRFYQFERLPVEGTFYKSTYRSKQEINDGKPIGTAMIGMYTNQPVSLSCFHRLLHDEIWHFYGGDPFKLILLHPNGSSQDILMGPSPINGEQVQFVIPAMTWQAGFLLPGGRYALFGCTMAPGFTGSCFEAATAEELKQQYPDRAEDIQRLSITDHIKRMPKDFAD
jgi:predicted cupin superfamily sugar epimerase